MNDAQRLAIRALFAASASPAEAIRALAEYTDEAFGSLTPANAGTSAAYALESLAEAALHAEGAELDAIDD
jgi:hypothetical protein